MRDGEVAISFRMKSRFNISSCSSRSLPDLHIPSNERFKKSFRSLLMLRTWGPVYFSTIFRVFWLAFQCVLFQVELIWAWINEDDDYTEGTKIVTKNHKQRIDITFTKINPGKNICCRNDATFTGDNNDRFFRLV